MYENIRVPPPPAPAPSPWGNKHKNIVETALPITPSASNRFQLKQKNFKFILFRTIYDWNKLDDRVINTDSVNSIRNRLSTSHFDSKCALTFATMLLHFVIPFNLIFNPTMFWKSWILTYWPHPKGRGGGGAAGKIFDTMFGGGG